MRAIAPLVLLAGLTNALPQAASSSCVTVTSEVIVPTTTYTFSSTSVTTETATTPEDLGTFTLVTKLSSTTTLETLTTTSTECTQTGTVTVPETTTVYTTALLSTARASSSPAPYRRDDALFGRSASACTVTYYSTTTYGATETYVPAGKTSTYTDYTAFSQTTVTSTQYGGTAYAIGTVTATTSAVCGPTVTASASTTTVKHDVRCAPTALVSEYDGFGLEYTEGPDLGGATYKTTAANAGACCQMCVEAYRCAASAWDIRNNACTLSFPVDNSGSLSCGEGFLAFYDAGPDHPMAPGTGLFVGTGCGSVSYANAPPDDGT